MAERLPEYDFAGPGRKPVYDQYLDGNIWRLKRGEDFQTTPDGVKRTLANRSRALGVKIRTQLEDDDTLVIQAIRN